MRDIALFTKPWKDKDLASLIKVLKELNYYAIELPIRKGYLIEPQNVERELPKIVDTLSKEGIVVRCIAAEPTEKLLKACDQSNIRLVRTMFMPKLTRDYLELEKEYIDKLKDVEVLCKQYKIKVGLQMHRGTGMVTTSDMMRIVSKFDKQYIGAVWDIAHSSIAGENPYQAIDICWSHLCYVNFKNAKYIEKEPNIFKIHYCLGHQGLANWKEVIQYLQQRGYEGDFCMHAEYSGMTLNTVENNAKKDHNYIKEIVNSII